MATTVSSSAPRVGEAAPDFSLDSTAGCEFSNDFDRFARANVAVLPISVDSVPTLREFKAKHAVRVEAQNSHTRGTDELMSTIEGLD